MLVVRRKVGQRIVIGSDVEVIVMENDRGGVRLGVVAPRGVGVVRGEIYELVVDANRRASATHSVDRADCEEESDDRREHTLR
jgi:carbon storage regulator